MPPAPRRPTTWNPATSRGSPGRRGSTVRQRVLVSATCGEASPVRSDADRRPPGADGATSSPGGLPGPEPLDPGPGLVDLAGEVVERAAVVDDVVGPGQALLAAGLSGHAGTDVGLAHAPVLDQPAHRHLGVDVDDEQPGDRVRVLRLDEQRHV